ncbi:conserved hypothetical protein [Ricinus communis]|uniref:Uncharacterized protein n=1 Tax=Ricinus communis TaxID=3988 RepID=B9SKQ9_RICCO|nr:conserved hypothetical protein [Ricinus communis]
MTKKKKGKRNRSSMEEDKEKYLNEKVALSINNILDNFEGAPFALSTYPLPNNTTATDNTTLMLKQAEEDMATNYDDEEGGRGGGGEGRGGEEEETKLPTRFYYGIWEK